MDVRCTARELEELYKIENIYVWNVRKYGDDLFIARVVIFEALP
jgi:hypothetical protein